MDRLRQLFNAVSAQALGMAYYVRIGRELGVVESVLGTLTYDDCCIVNAQMMKGMERDEIVAGREDAFNRLRSENATLRRTGLAQWLCTAFLETRDVMNDSVQQRHVDIKRTIRALQKRAAPPVARARVRAAVGA